LLVHIVQKNSSLWLLFFLLGLAILGFGCFIVGQVARFNLTSKTWLSELVNVALSTL